MEAGWRLYGKKVDYEPALGSRVGVTEEWEAERKADADSLVRVLVMPSEIPVEG